jgi:hypothetical protein
MCPDSTWKTLQTRYGTVKFMVLARGVAWWKALAKR